MRPAIERHGTYSRYVKGGCRCRLCRKAMRDAGRRQRMRKSAKELMPKTGTVFFRMPVDRERIARPKPQRHQHITPLRVGGGLPIANGSWWLDAPRDGFFKLATQESKRMNVNSVIPYGKSDTFLMADR